MAITAKQLERLNEINQERKPLEQKARLLAAEAEAIEDAIKADLDAAGQTTAKRGNYRITLEEKPGRVSWKAEAEKRMKTGEEPERPITRRLVLTLATLLLLVSAVGCLKSTPPAPSGPQSGKGYTGAVVYTDEFCQPCDNLKADLRWLAENHGWSIGGNTSNADWIIRNGCDGTVPRIEYFRDGKVIDKARGYSVAPTLAQRKAALRAIVEHHPNKTK